MSQNDLINSRSIIINNSGYQEMFKNSQSTIADINGSEEMI